MRLYEKYLSVLKKQFENECPDEALVFDLTSRLPVLMTVQAVRNKAKFIKTNEDYEVFIQTFHKLGKLIHFQSGEDQSGKAKKMREDVWRSINRFKRYPFYDADFIADVNYATEKIATSYLEYLKEIHNYKGGNSNE